jgi:hypothetical protein
VSDGFPDPPVVGLVEVAGAGQTAAVGIDADEVEVFLRT